MTSPAVQLDDEGVLLVEHVAQDGTVGARPLPSSARQAVRSFDVAEVAELQG